VETDGFLIYDPMKIQIQEVTQYQDIDAGVTLQSVAWSISEAVKGNESEAVLLTGIQSFPLSATAEDIKSFLVRRLEVYKQDVASHERSQELQDNLDNATKVAEEVGGLTIND
jgi:hypothetical protein